MYLSNSFKFNYSYAFKELNMPRSTKIIKTQDRHFEDGYDRADHKRWVKKSNKHVPGSSTTGNINIHINYYRLTF